MVVVAMRIKIFVEELLCLVLYAILSHIILHWCHSILCINLYTGWLSHHRHYNKAFHIVVYIHMLSNYTLFWATLHNEYYRTLNIVNNSEDLKRTQSYKLKIK